MMRARAGVPVCERACVRACVSACLRVCVCVPVTAAHRDSGCGPAALALVNLPLGLPVVGSHLPRAHAHSTMARWPPLAVQVTADSDRVRRECARVWARGPTKQRGPGCRGHLGAIQAPGP